MRIGLFGGTYNPIHACHLAIAAETRDRLALDRVVFVPSGDPPHKTQESLAPAVHRYEMVRLAIEPEPTFSASDMELQRPNKSYSIDTVRAFRAELGSETELFFIMGLDSFVEFPTWRQAADLLKLCHIVVVSRPGMAFSSLFGFALLPPLDPTTLEAVDSGRQERLDMILPGGTSVVLLQIPPCDVSASEVRRRLKAGLSLPPLLPGSVESYIIRHGLYQEEPNRTGF